MSTIGTTNTPSFIKIREVTLQFLGDLTWNDPYTLIDLPGDGAQIEPSSIFVACFNRK